MATTLPPDDLPDIALPPAEPDAVRDASTVRRQRLRALWAAALLALVLVAGMAAWLVHTVSIDQSLRAVGQATVLPPAALPAPAAAPVVPEPVALAAASLAPDETLVDPAGLAAAAVATTARQGESAASEAVRHASRDEPVRKVRKKVSPTRKASAARSPRDRTFVRCPQLGKPGAVMCSWHICNGGAGKEAACRPYLERRP